ncbi:MAG: STAS domain-containing protein [bacterium]|nr:STAS domain-containing protein [bacterium]
MSIVHISKNNNKIIFKFTDRMDTNNCMKSENAILDAIENVNEIVFDMSNVEYIASSFLRLSSKISHKIGIKKFKIANTSPMIRKVFKISGLDKRLNLTDDTFIHKMQPLI